MLTTLMCLAVATLVVTYGVVLSRKIDQLL
jgi:hypothetical protein